MSNWWDEPLRAVTLEFPAADVATIDVKGIVDETRRGRVNTLGGLFHRLLPGRDRLLPEQDRAALSRPRRARFAGGRHRKGTRQRAKGRRLSGIDLGQPRSLFCPSRLGAAQSRRPRHDLGR